MNTRFERDIYLFLSLYRFFAYGLAVVIIQVAPLSDLPTTPLQTYTLLGTVGVYTLLRILGPLRWRQLDTLTYVVLGGDLVVGVLVIMLTGGLNSGFLLYSLTPVLTASLLFNEKLALAAAAITSSWLALAHLLLNRWVDTYLWIMESNYLLWLVVYIVASFLMATVVYRTNLNIRRRIESDAIGDERGRMRREIHDGVAQTLSYLSLKADTVRRWLEEKDIPKALAAVKEVTETVAEAHKDIRESLDQLNVEAGLAPLLPTLEEYLRDFGRDNGIEPHFEAPEAPVQLSPVVELQAPLRRKPWPMLESTPSPRRSGSSWPTAQKVWS